MAKTDVVEFATNIARRLHSANVLDGGMESGLFLIAEDQEIVDIVMEHLAHIMRGEHVDVMRMHARDLISDDGYDRMIHAIENSNDCRRLKRSSTLVDAVGRVLQTDEKVLVVLLSEIQKFVSSPSGHRILAGLKAARDAKNIPDCRGKFFFIAGGAPPSVVRALVDESCQPFYGAIVMNC